MNTPAFTRTNKRTFTKALVLASAAIVMIAGQAQADWSVDFSRRARQSRETDLNAAAKPYGDRAPASANAAPVSPSVSTDVDDSKSKGLFDTVFETGEPIQEIVILNTERGFVPSTVRVRKNGRYKVTVVNVNEKEKNVSFILDGFSEHHATYYGKTKTFMLEPKKDGVFSYQSPETAAEGKLVVFNPQATIRIPASE
ncbi:MAG: hypothetical protein V4760_16750 [Bdellovibrionota bacterium]